MCGIAGFVGLGFSVAQLSDIIRLACKQLKHRGPDEEGYYVEEGVALGCSRLAIRDPEKGHQPMSFRGWTLVFNGELYNTYAFQEKLTKAGYHFQSQNDTEVFLYAFIEYGWSILEQLEGMFAFALWDGQSQTLHLGKDRWGEKPLYYTFNEQFITFASEIKGLQVWPHLQWDISIEDLQLFMRNSYINCPRTGWENVFKLEQGSYLTWCKGEVAQRRYFHPRIDVKPVTAEELYYLLDQSVKQCTVSDKPVGAFLSGGIDSSTVAHLLSKQGREIPFFSLDWEEKSHSEQVYAQEIVRALKLKHFTVKCDADFFRNSFESVCDLYDEPFGDESMIPTFCLAKFAKQHVDVVLTGDGADEFFHGYERYFFEGDPETYRDVFAATSIKTQQQIWDLEFKEENCLSNDIRSRSWNDINTYLPNNILMKVDRATMSVGLEARAPFLTSAVTNFALKCSMDQLVGKNLMGKEILRRAMKNHLPSMILDRKKMGFGVPLQYWFRSSLREWMQERLLNGSLMQTGWFSKGGIDQLVFDYLHRGANGSRTLFNLLVLEHWVRKKVHSN